MNEQSMLFFFNSNNGVRTIAHGTWQTGENTLRLEKEFDLFPKTKDDEDFDYFLINFFIIKIFH